MDEVMKLVERMKKGAPLAQKMIKRVLNRKCREDWDWTMAMMPAVFASEEWPRPGQHFWRNEPPSSRAGSSGGSDV